MTPRFCQPESFVAEACWFSHSEPRSPSRTGQDKTLLCKFWLKNRCDRSNCKYAHGEEEKRRACKAIMCLFEALSGLSRQGCVDDRLALVM
ncbi:mkrn1 [Symbiodinium natans]|uniref:Mkrn1 protein n=1 Tax=Symbiodinium natans TaxID=878477 RepID=A0A812R2Y5_9DINO|nr:mkrn1 [Symbiodinium natans]